MMVRIIAPNKGYSGISAGVPFTGGVADTDNPYLIDWFKSHGYIVEDDKPEDQTENKPAETKPKRSRKKVG